MKKPYVLIFIALLLLPRSLVFAESTVSPGQFCPVSGDKAKSKFTYAYKGKTYKFCCAHCIKDFKKDPEGYLSGKLKEPSMM